MPACVNSRTCCIIAGHGYRIAAELAYHVARLIEVAKDWYSVDDRSRQFLSRQAQTNYLHSAVRLPLDPVSELLGRSRASGDDDVPDTPALLLQAVKEFPG